MTAPPQGAPRTLWALIIDNSLLLLAGTVAALIWANVDLHSYEAFSHGAVHFAVNDIGMVFFFALAVKEIVEATRPGGPLESPREAAVPLLAAAGGMIVPAGLFALLVIAVDRPELMPGWAVPCATDIAFSYMAARLIFPPHHPAIPFLLLLAIADDAMGLMLLAVFYPSGPLSFVNFAALMIPAVALSYWMRRRGVRSYWPYVIFGGGLSWGALFLGGVHPALALVPILPFMPHAQRDLGIDDPREAHLTDTMNRFEHAFKVPVQLVLLMFGLVNAGVPFGSVGSGTWIVLAGLVIGKPIGILLMTVIGVKMGLRAPGGLTYAHTLVVGIAAGIGFTVALFFSAAAFAPGLVLDEVKVGALFSFLAAPLAIALGRAMGLKPQVSNAPG